VKLVKNDLLYANTTVPFEIYGGGFYRRLPSSLCDKNGILFPVDLGFSCAYLRPKC
jgi:hypothetical protein